MPTGERRVMVEIRNVEKYFGKLKALDGVSLDIYDGEKMVIIGPSGSGKSTLLRSINRLETIQGGRIFVDGIDVQDEKTDINKVREEIGMVFQSFNVFPHKTVMENVNLAQMVVRKRSRKEATRSPRNSSRRSAFSRRPTNTRISSPAASSSGSPSPGRWR